MHDPGANEEREDTIPISGQIEEQAIEQNKHDELAKIQIAITRIRHDTNRENHLITWTTTIRTQIPRGPPTEARAWRIYWPDKY